MFCGRISVMRRISAAGSAAPPDPDPLARPAAGPRHEQLNPPPPLNRFLAILLCLSAFALTGLAAAAAAGAQVPTLQQTSAAAPYSARVGISTHMRYFPQANITYQLRRISSGGVKWIREDFAWPQLEPQRGVYDWRLSDELMKGASAARVSVLPIIGMTPKWASSDPSGNGEKTWPPRDNADYARFVDAVVARYGRNGSFWKAHPNLAPMPITTVQLWNEPWGFFSWKPEPDPARYAALAKAGSRAAKARDPYIKVIAVGDILQSRTDKVARPWLAELLKDRELVGLTDAWGTAAYPGPRNQGPYESRSRPEYNFGRIRMLRDMTLAANAARPIWITEIGWSTGPNDPEKITEAKQAEYMNDAVRRITDEWGGFVEKAFLYSWDRPLDAADNGYKIYGLRRDNDTLLPAWKAVTDVTRFGPPAAWTAPNLPPVAGFKSSAVTVRAWDKVTFTSTSRDPDGMITSHAWDVDNDGFFDDEWRTQTTREYKYVGTYRIRLRVTDKHGAESVATWVVNVVPRPPGT